MAEPLQAILKTPISASDFLNDSGVSGATVANALDWLNANKQPLDATLTALAGLTIAANSLSIGTGADAFSQTSFAANTFPARASTGDLVAKSITDFGLSLVDDATAGDARTTLGLGSLATVSNLTGPITSVGAATSVAAQTGTGSTFAMQTTPTLTNASINQAADGNTALSSTRFTDTSPTGNFIDFKTAAASTIFGVNVAGNLGVGIAPTANSAILASKSVAEPAATIRIINLSSTTNSITGHNANVFIGVSSDTECDQNGFNLTATRGIRAIATIAAAKGASGDVTGISGIYLQGTNSGAGNALTIDGVTVPAVTNTGGGGVSANNGVNVLAQTVGTLITGLRSQIALASGRWNLYCDGTAANYINGNLLSGTTTVPTNLTFGIALSGGTSSPVDPTAQADTVSFYRKDSAATKANGFAVNEEGQVNRLTGLACRVASDFSKTSDTTLANITGLSRSVEAGAVYGFRAVLFTTSNVAGGVKVAISGTATATSIIYEADVVSAGVLSVPGTTRATALDTTVGNVTAVTVARITIEGEIVVNAAGTLTVQFAQNVSDGTASVVKAGSYFNLISIGS